MGIKKDLKDGDIGEKIVIKLLERCFAATKNKNMDTRQYYDVIAYEEGFDAHGNYLETDPFTLEVKYDLYSDKSGNIAIEFWNSRQGKPSGINITSAKFWVQVTPAKGVWITTVEKLKQYIKDNKAHKIILNAGDGNANLYLYKVNKILPSIFTRIDKLKDKDLKNIIIEML